MLKKLLGKDFLLVRVITIVFILNTSQVFIIGF